MLKTAPFRNRLIAGGVLDPEGFHHAFAYGAHGRKLDFGTIETGSPLYDEWVAVNVQHLKLQPRLPRAVLGIANGTNQLALDIGSELGIMALSTLKVSPREVALTNESLEQLSELLPTDEITAIEDVGTSGGTVLTGLQSVQAAGFENVSAQITWQRTETLSALVAAGIMHRSVVYEPLPTFEPLDCASDGYCAKGWDLIPHH